MSEKLPLWTKPLAAPEKSDRPMDAIVQVACDRPDIYLDHDRSCDFCPHYPYCTVNARRHSTDPKRKRIETEEKIEVSKPVIKIEEKKDSSVPVKRGPGRPKGSKNK